MSLTHHLEGCMATLIEVSKEYEGEQAEPHRSVQAENESGREIEASCIRKEGHNYHCHQRTDKQVRLATSHPAPGTVGPFSDERLDKHSHQRREYPEETQLMRISAQSGEYAADVRTLKRICNLNSKKRS